MNNQTNMNNIPDEKFVFAQKDVKLHDEKLATKPIGYFRDAWIRFRKNKGSIVGGIIILLIVLYAIIVPFVSNYSLSYSDGIYKKLRPKINALSNFSWFDGGTEQKLNDRYLAFYMAMGVGALDTDGNGVKWEDAEKSEYNPIISLDEEFENSGKTYRYGNIDTYLAVGFKYMSISMDEYEKMKAWQEENGKQLLYPMIDTENEFCADPADANYWYKSVGANPVDEKGNKLSIEKIKKVGFTDNYLRDENGNVTYYKASDKTMVQVRVLYYNYYQYVHGFAAEHYFGTDGQGYDIFVRLAYGLRLSLLLAVCVSAINLTIGGIYGAIEGYYGGIVDLIGERISDIISGIPFIIVATLASLHLINTGKMSAFTGLILCYILTGWIGTAYSVRTQFYRFKNQEYVLAARTLGARDRRLMFKHIFPNSLGTLITSSVLVIPSAIFTESILSYLGIITFNGKSLTSLGTLLSNGQQYLSTDPHIILFPCIFISLLMLSFNLFGNGLRDAFNPSLRGAEE